MKNRGQGTIYKEDGVALIKKPGVSCEIRRPGYDQIRSGGFIRVRSRMMNKTTFYKSIEKKYIYDFENVLLIIYSNKLYG
jgi:hypothetical protein